MPLVLGQHVDRSYYDLDHKFTVLKEPTHPSVRQLLDFWRACEGKDGLRMGRDIPSRATAPFLSLMMIVEPFADWADGTVRYAGFGTAKFFGRDVTGLRYSEVSVGDRSRTLWPLFTEARVLVEENRCRILDHRASSGGIEVARQEVVTFPIFGPDGTSRWVLSAAFDF